MGKGKEKEKEKGRGKKAHTIQCHSTTEAAKFVASWTLLAFVSPRE